ncbi:MAG: isoprenylcysteine carboxylmethyltransferase family protein [Acidobacteriota bacterium]
MASKKAYLAMKGFWQIALFITGYLLIVLLCLRQWRSSTPWERLNFFAMAALLLSCLLAVQQLRLTSKLPDAQDVIREAFGINFDPQMGKFVGLLAFAELFVFIDYAHWQLVPALENRILQTIGLALYGLDIFWLVWVDAYLANHFASVKNARQVITDGPYSWVRHPRYVGLILSRIAFALAFASVLGWLIVIGWIWVVNRRIRLEEPHLNELFGTAYDDYARRTARLIPHLY